MMELAKERTQRLIEERRRAFCPVEYERMVLRGSDGDIDRARWKVGLREINRKILESAMLADHAELARLMKEGRTPALTFGSRTGETRS